jgi:mRNA interferase HigB
MRVVGQKLLYDFADVHPDVKQRILAWIAEVEAATWRTFHELRQQFGSASSVGNKRVVFNLKGGRYRLLVKVRYDSQLVLVERIGTHAEYDQWDL